MAEERKIAEIKCTNCGKSFKMYIPQNGGIRKVNCPHCKGTMNINFGTPKTEPKNDNTTTTQQQGQTTEQPAKKKTKDISDSNGGMQKAKLVQVRGFLRKNISHTLQLGDNIIGQYDTQQPSTIQIKDNTISRRSVNIKANYDNGSIDYVLCVLRSTNPVYLNGAQINVGDERFLSFGDEFILGNTKFRFEKA